MCGRRGPGHKRPAPARAEKPWEPDDATRLSRLHGAHGRKQGLGEGKGVGEEAGGCSGKAAVPLVALSGSLRGSLSLSVSFSPSPQDLPCSGPQGLKLKSRGSRGLETSRIWAGQCSSGYGHASAAVRGAPSAEAVVDAGWRGLAVGCLGPEGVPTRVHDGAMRFDGGGNMLGDQTLEAVSRLRDLCQVSGPNSTALSDREGTAMGGAGKLRRAMLETL